MATTEPRHQKLRPNNGGIHVIQAYEYADAAARTAATGFISDDVGKVARQLDNETYWVLTAPTPTWQEITTVASGEVNLAANVGAGQGLIFRDKTGVTLNFKTILAGANVTVTDNPDTVEIATAAGSGEVNTASNVNVGGVGVFKQKTGTDLEFYGVNSSTSALSVALDAANNEIDLGFVPGNVTHADLGGLTTDDHTQYILVAGTRAYTGSQSFGNFDATNFRTASFNQELDNGNSGTAATITWGNAQKQFITLTDNVTLTFSAPPGPCNLVLRLVQDATGSRSVTWPGAVLWPNGVSPSIQSGGGNTQHVVSLYYNGTNYYGIGSLNFS